ncbi:MAG: DMT family transporter [Bacteroidota bacterium]
MNVYVILVTHALLSSGTYLVAKVVVADVEPVTLTLFRAGIAAIALVILALYRGTSFSFAKEDRPKIFFLGVLAIPLNQFLFLAAIKHTTPGNAALLFATTPTLVLLISAFMGHEKLTRLKTLGVITAFAGILIVIFEKGIDFRSDFMVGNLLLCVSVAAWALFTVFGRPMILKYGAFTTSAAAMILGAMMYLPFSIFNAVKFHYAILSLADYSGILYLALITSVVMYVLWTYALRKTEASKVAIFSNLQPVLTTILAVVLLGQIITPVFIVGGSIALAGVVLTQFG